MEPHRLILRMCVITTTWDCLKGNKSISFPPIPVLVTATKPIGGVSRRERERSCNETATKQETPTNHEQVRKGTAVQADCGSRAQAEGEVRSGSESGGRTGESGERKDKGSQAVEGGGNRAREAP